jgi:hypothetical protein
MKISMSDQCLIKTLIIGGLAIGDLVFAVLTIRGPRKHKEGNLPF